MAYRRREDNLSDVLTDEQVDELLMLRHRGMTQKELADYFDVHRNTIRNIVLRDRDRKRKARANG